MNSDSVVVYFSGCLGLSSVVDKDSDAAFGKNNDTMNAETTRKQKTSAPNDR